MTITEAHVIPVDWSEDEISAVLHRAVSEMDSMDVADDEFTVGAFKLTHKHDGRVLYASYLCDEGKLVICQHASEMDATEFTDRFVATCGAQKVKTVADVFGYKVEYCDPEMN